ncbi:MAG: hypothetical protein AAF707_04310 [Pseudomonadota bacterium]
MLRLRLGAAAALALACTTQPVLAQTGWSREPTDFGTFYQSERSNSTVLVLLLWEIDQKTGSNLLSLPDSASETVIEQALAAMPFTVEEIVSEDLSNQRMPKVTGYASTPDGRRAFAATLSNRGTSRRLVVMFDDPAKIDKLIRRVGSVSNFRSNIAAADRPGWVPGQQATGSSYSGSRTARATSAASSSSANTRASTRSARYTLPTDQSDFNKWRKVGDITFSPNPSDPLAPRGYRAKLGSEYGLTSFDSAMRKLAEVAGITIAGDPHVQRLGSWSAYDGREARLMMVPTTRAGTKGVLMLYLVQLKGDRAFSFLGYEVPEKTFLDGGGIVRMMLIRGIVPSDNVFPDNQVERIARAPFKQQMAFYDAALTKLYETKKRQFIASQSAVTMRMMELNYDLLLGGDISSPFIAD